MQCSQVLYGDGEKASELEGEEGEEDEGDIPRTNHIGEVASLVSLVSLPAALDLAPAVTSELVTIGKIITPFNLCQPVSLSTSMMKMP